MLVTKVSLRPMASRVAILAMLSASLSACQSSDSVDLDAGRASFSSGASQSYVYEGASYTYSVPRQARAASDAGTILIVRPAERVVGLEAIAAATPAVRAAAEAIASTRVCQGAAPTLSVVQGSRGGYDLLFDGWGYRVRCT